MVLKLSSCMLTSWQMRTIFCGYCPGVPPSWPRPPNAKLGGSAAQFLMLSVRWMIPSFKLLQTDTTGIHLSTSSRPTLHLSTISPSIIHLSIICLSTIHLATVLCPSSIYPSSVCPSSFWPSIHLFNIHLSIICLSVHHPPVHHPSIHHLCVQPTIFYC